MSLMPMQKVALFFPRGEREHVLALLQDKGAVEILDLKETPVAEMVEVTEAGMAGDADRMAGDIRRAIDDVSEFEEKGGILSGLGGGRVMVTKEEFDRTPQAFDYQLAVREIGDLEAGRTELRTRRNHLEAFIDRLQPWAGLDVPLEDIASGDHAVILAGVIAGGRTPEMLRSALSEAVETAYLEVVHSVERETYLVVFYDPGEDEAAREVLRKSDFEAHTFENLKGLPAELIAEAEREIASVDRELEDLAARGRELVRHKPKLMIVHDYFSEEARRIAARSFVGNTERVGVMQGWVRVEDFQKLAGDIERRIDSAEVMRIEPEPGEDPPIELKNKPVMKPFEVITELYGMPHAKEIDPTPLAGPFFGLFFGFCLTDAGYGIVLAALSLVLMKYLKAARKILWLAFIGGLFTILMGAITGGWFGITDDTIPAWLGFLGTMRRSLMQFDPLENPMILFGLALALGFVQVTFGLAIRMVEHFRNKEIMAGIFEQFTWIVLLWAVLFLGLVKLGALPQSYTPGIKWMGLVAALGIVGFTNRVSKNPAVRVGSGIYRLYNIATSSLGDILSYTRLLALGMATGGIAMVINVIALIAKDIPIVGIPAMIFVLVAGHSFNIAVNTLGGFVHSARLQYVEFYPKFFEGGGRPFKPFKKDLRYTTLVEKAS
jgi:V/A-type H+-transporting ATPase subunit I